MKTGRLIRIGLLFVITIIILFWGLNYLKGKNFLRPERVYYAKYEKVGNLMNSSPVTINGLRVGEVREIGLNSDSYDEILVRFVLSNPDIKLPVGTQAKIYSIDLMGTKGIQLIVSGDSVIHEYGDTLPGLIEGDLKDQVNTQMLPLKRKAEELMASMDSVLVSLSLVFDQENRSNLAQSFESVNQTLRNVEQSTVFLDSYVKNEAGKFSGIMSSIDTLSNELIGRAAELQNAIENLATFTDTLANVPLRQVVTKFNQSLTAISRLISGVNAGEGSLGKLVVDDSLYFVLQEAGENLNALIADIQLNPKRYVRVSAFDRGKTIVTTSDADLIQAIRSSNDQEYFLCIMQTNQKLQETDGLFKEFKKLQVIKIGNSYFYYVESSRKLDPVRRKLAHLVKNFPDAKIYTWVNNQWRSVSY